MKIKEIYAKYGDPIYVGSKHMVWRDVEQNRAVKATRPGYLTGGQSIITSQPWHEPADPESPRPSVQEMTDCMRNFGFSQDVSGDWLHPEGAVARNVTPEDFIKTKDSVVPIDIDLEKQSDPS